MNEEGQSSEDGVIQSSLPEASYALEVSIGGVVEQRHPLRRDRPTWTGRLLDVRSEEYDYIQIPECLARYLCLFEWDPKEGRFWVRLGGVASAWLNAQTREARFRPSERRLLNDGDVVIVSGPHYPRLTLMRCGA